MTLWRRDWQYHTCDECGDAYPSVENSFPRAWVFDEFTGRLICDACTTSTEGQRLSPDPENNTGAQQSATASSSSSHPSS